MIIHVVGAFIFAMGFADLIYATAAKQEGQMQSIGNLLAIAVAAISAFFLVGMLTAPLFGGRPFGMDIHHERGPARDALSNDSAAPNGAPAETPAGKPGAGGPPPPGKPQ